MREVVKFVAKGIRKNKYIYLLAFVILLITSSLLFINNAQISSTQDELQQAFDKRKESLDFLISKTLIKKRYVGLPENQQLALDSLLVQEDYVKRISQRLSEGDMDIAKDNLAFINEYLDYRKYNFIHFENEDLLEIEKDKLNDLAKHDLPFTEQQTPVKTALFTKQLLHLLLNPLTALIFLLMFCYKYTTDERNRTFDFLKVNSLSNPAIYYGYVFSSFLFMVGYLLFSVVLAFLPPLFTGNLKTVYYPLEVAIGGSTAIVPAWKWLLYLPIGWGIFVSLLLVVASWLCKQRVSLGVLAGFIFLPLLCLYLLAEQLGFSMLNPIHLVVGYDANLFPSNQFIIYLVGMLLLLLLLIGASYPIFRSKRMLLLIKGRASGRRPYQPKSQLKLIQFEHLKRRRDGRIFFVLLLLVGISVGTSIFVNQQYKSVDGKIVKAIEELQSFFISNQFKYKLMEEEEEVEKVDSTDETPLVKFSEVMEKDIALLEEVKKKANTPAFHHLYRETLKSLGPGTSQSYKELESNQWSVTTMASEEQQKLLKEREMQPWPIGGLWISNFDDPSREPNNELASLLKMVQEENEKYGHSAIFTAFFYMNHNIVWSVLALFVFVLWVSLAEEHRLGRTVHFLVTKPLHLRSVYVSKWAYNLATACLFFLFSGGIAFVVSWLLGGYGEADYPIPTYAIEETESGEGQFFSPVDNVYFSFDSVQGMVLKSVALILAQIFFLNSLFSFIGRWMKNQYAVVIATLLITVAGYLFASQYPSLYMMFNPFLYFNTWHVVDGWQSILLESPLVNVGTGCLVLIAAGTVLFLVGLIPNKGKVS